jgi:threonine dehydrogenase-like Zn-dependent dehydrogenase
MKASCWHGKSDTRSRQCRIKKTNSRDAIIEVTACLICDSDLHIYNNVIPEMEMGDVMRPGDSSR